MDGDADSREYPDDTISETSCDIGFPPPIPWRTQDMFCVQRFDSSDCTTGHIAVMPNPSYMGVHKATVWNMFLCLHPSIHDRQDLFLILYSVWVYIKPLCEIYVCNLCVFVSSSFIPWPTRLVFIFDFVDTGCQWQCLSCSQATAQILSHSGGVVVCVCSCVHTLKGMSTHLSNHMMFLTPYSVCDYAL